MRKPPLYRFHELTSDNVNVDYHVHTSRTDGKETVAAILKSAFERRLSAIAFTEHVRHDTAWFPEFASEIRQERKHFPDLRVYIGCEAKALDANGRIDASTAILSESDIVLGSVHSFPPECMQGRFMTDLEPAEFMQIELDLSLGLLHEADIDVLAHPAGMSFKRFGKVPESVYEQLLQESLKRNIAIEINPSYLENLGAFLKLCLAINPYVSIGSDAHRLEEVGVCRSKLLDFM